MTMPEVLVLMATCNGQEHLAAQLDSVLAQEGAVVSVHVCDDCSTDNTYRILETYALEHDALMINYHTQRLGIDRSIMELVYAAPIERYDFIALAQQDAIWASDRLRCGIRHISANTSRPELYYAGYEEVAQGACRSSLQAEFGECMQNPPSLLFVANWAAGPTMLMNSSLAKLLRLHPVFDFGRSYAAWIHAVSLYCDAFVYGELEKSPVKCYSSPLEREGFAPGLLRCDKDARQQRTQMAAALEREYSELMAPSVLPVVKAAASRGFSARARRLLFARKDIVAPAGCATPLLRLALLLDRY